MTLEHAQKLVGRRPSWELRNIVKALSLHTWLNDDDDDARLEASKLVLHSRKQGTKS